MRAFSSRGEGRATLYRSAQASHSCEALALGMPASVVVAGGLQSAGSVAVTHRFSCPLAWGIFPD